MTLFKKTERKDYAFAPCLFTVCSAHGRQQTKRFCFCKLKTGATKKAPEKPMLYVSSH